MPNPNAIDVPNLGFSEVQTTILQIMMNKEEIDYSTVDELSVYHYDKESERNKLSVYAQDNLFYARRTTAGILSYFKEVQRSIGQIRQAETCKLFLYDSGMAWTFKLCDYGKSL